MHTEVKRLADSGDMIDLKYIFVDALDVDPTFEEYQEDYEYCRSKGLFEKHQELTPLIWDQGQWTLDYWVQLKTDLLKNFSDERLMHMKKVAQVLKADKILRLAEERKLRKEKVEKKKTVEETRQTKFAQNQKKNDKPTSVSTETSASETRCEIGKAGIQQQAEKEKLLRTIIGNLIDNLDEKTRKYIRDNFENEKNLRTIIDFLIKNHEQAQGLVKSDFECDNEKVLRVFKDCFKEKDKKYSNPDSGVKPDRSAPPIDNHPNVVIGKEPKKVSPVVMAAVLLGIIILLAVILVMAVHPGNTAEMLYVLSEMSQD